jgi:hypothetical protein
MVLLPTLNMETELWTISQTLLTPSPTWPPRKDSNIGRGQFQPRLRPLLPHFNHHLHPDQ